MRNLKVNFFLFVNYSSVMYLYTIRNTCNKVGSIKK